MSAGSALATVCSQKDVVRMRTRAGTTVDVAGTKWSYRDGLVNVSIDFELAAAFLDGAMLSSFRSTLLWYVENASPQHLMNM